MLNILLFLMLNISPTTQSDQLFVASDSLFNNRGIIDLGIREGWRFYPGDNLNWANPDYDDSDWMFYKPWLLEPIPESLWNGYGWFRYRFAADSSVYAKVTNLYLLTYGAADVYLDGKLVRKYGVFSTDMKGEKLYNPMYNIPPAILMQQGESHLLAVRFSYHKGQQYKKLLGKHAVTFGFRIGLATDDFNQYMISLVNKQWQLVYILCTMLFLIVLLHGLLFALFPTERSNLYITIIAFLLFLSIFSSHVELLFEPNILMKTLFHGMLFTILVFAITSLVPFTINSMFNQKPRQIHKILIWLFPIFALANFIFFGPYMNYIITIIIASVVVFFSSQILIQAIRNKQKGVWFVAAAFFGLVLSAVAYFIYSQLTKNYWNEFSKLLVYIAYASLPLGLTAFMASRFRDLYTNLEQKVTERTRELNQSLEELRSTQSQLIQSEKMASLGQLTAGIAHEIQNPLNFVNNFSEVNKELIDEADQEIDKGNISEVKTILKNIKENEQKINHHGKRADSIVKGMLQHSRTSTGQKEPTDINALADEYLRLSYHGLRAKDKTFNADFKTEFDETLPKINVIPHEIGRVLLNLINNAFYAVDKRAKDLPPPPHEGGAKNDQNMYRPTVTISTTSYIPPSGASPGLSGGKGVRIAVKDNGAGIPAHIIDKIFQPFFTTKPTGQGTGLGLSLAYDIVKAHGGELKVETKEGEGSEFITHLPIKI